MYRYDEFDESFVRNRVAEFRGQVERRLSGALTEDEFKPLRLRNGLYLQLHAYMFRVAVPYGSMNSAQMRQLAMIADRWDKGYGHFTTRQNIQFNWPTLESVPDILDALAEVGMHAMQTSGNCIRNVTADHFAGASHDEIEDPRPLAELIRQWSTDHPEFAHLPRKFKFAVTGSPNDRAVTRAHDIGVRIVGKGICEIIVGGGLGRTPVVGKVLNSELPVAELLPYLEAILRVYNLAGRRDNKYKARIKILVNDTGIEKFRAQVAHEYQSIKVHFEQNGGPVSAVALQQIENYFNVPELKETGADSVHQSRLKSDAAYARWCNNNLAQHKAADHHIVTVSLKGAGEIPGDASSDQMRAVAGIAERFSHNEIRVSHEQNLVLPHVSTALLPQVYDELVQIDLATPNAGLISDIIACPGMDYCALATARSIPVAQEISTHFANPAYAETIGKMSIKISGCINACGHHHVGNIGILGLDKRGRENYQFTLGGDPSEAMQLGERAGPGVDADEVVPALERVIKVYLDTRTDSSETFQATCNRVGNEPFKKAIYEKTAETSPPFDEHDAATDSSLSLAS